MRHTFNTTLKNNSSNPVTITTSSGITYTGPFGVLYQELKDIDLKYEIVTITDNTTQEIIFDRRQDHYITYLEDFMEHTDFKFSYEQ